MLVALAHADVRDVEPYGERRVAGKVPWRRRPRQEVGLRLVHEFELDVDRRIFDIVSIALCQFVAGERGLVPRAIGDDFETLVEQVLVPDLLENPPDAL